MQNTAGGEFDPDFNSGDGQSQDRIPPKTAGDDITIEEDDNFFTEDEDASVEEEAPGDDNED
jgi:hypothetical protein